MIASSRVDEEGASTGGSLGVVATLRTSSTISQVPKAAAGAAQYQFCCRNSTKGDGCRVGDPGVRRVSSAQKTSRINTISCRAFVADAVIDSVGVLARLQHTLVAQDGEMLGDVALRGAHRVDDVPHAFFAAAEHATEDLGAQGMRDRP